MARSKAEIEKELSETSERLAAYLEREKVMLSTDGVKAYGIGSRNLQRYDTALTDVQKMIKELRQQERELEAQLRGCSPRKAIGVVPRDW